MDDALHIMSHVSHIMCCKAPKNVFQTTKNILSVPIFAFAWHFSLFAPQINLFLEHFTSGYEPLRKLEKVKKNSCTPKNHKSGILSLLGKLTE